MKRTYLLMAVICCAITVSAKINYYDELPSGSGIYERTLLNFEYNRESNMLTFEDVFMTNTTAYSRTYHIFAHVWRPEYKFVENISENGHVHVYFGSEEGGSSFIRRPISESERPIDNQHMVYMQYNSKGGRVGIDISMLLEELKSICPSADYLISVAPRYYQTETSQDVIYSQYNADLDSFFLLNSKHISVAPTIYMTQNNTKL